MNKKTNENKKTAAAKKSPADKKSTASKKEVLKKEFYVDKKNIGRNVQLLRNTACLSQADLSEMLGVSPIHLSHIETGTVGMSIEIMLAMCKFLSVTPNDILNGEYTETSDNVNPKTFFEKSSYLTENDQEILLGLTEIMAKINREKNGEE